MFNQGTKAASPQQPGYYGCTGATQGEIRESTYNPCTVRPPSGLLFTARCLL